jgi:hypothetical protein
MNVRLRAVGPPLIGVRCGYGVRCATAGDERQPYTRAVYQQHSDESKGMFACGRAAGCFDKPQNGKPSGF